jgi:PadR family transcriptional regulator, regulatory protein PadR
MPRLQRGLIKGITPMLVLAVINDGELYGYEIVQTLRDQSSGAFEPSEGSLYPILHRLELEGHLVATWRASEKGPPRRYYRLTPKGQGLLAESTAEWASLVRAVAGVTAGAS